MDFNDLLAQVGIPPETEAQTATREEAYREIRERSIRRSQRLRPHQQQEEWSDEAIAEQTSSTNTESPNSEEENSSESQNVLFNPEFIDIARENGIYINDNQSSDNEENNEEDEEEQEEEHYDAHMGTTERNLDDEEDEDWRILTDLGAIRIASTEEEGVYELMPEVVGTQAIVQNTTEQTVVGTPSAVIATVDSGSSETNINNVVETPAESAESNFEQEPIPEDQIPENSPTLLINEATSRFSGTEWYNEIQKTRIIIAGCGGIGSNLAFQIARMAPEKIILYDDDRVETVNMSGQLFSREDAGKEKVNAITNMILKYTTAGNVFAIPEKYTENTTAGDIMLCGFDSMSARRIFYNSWEKHIMEKPEEERKNCLFMDGRLSIDTLQVLCIRGDDNYNMERYKREFLFSDSEADHTVCSMKQTTYMACMIGSIMVNLFTNHIAQLLNPVMPYSTPFFTEYDAHYMMFKIEN